MGNGNGRRKLQPIRKTLDAKSYQNLILSDLDVLGDIGDDRYHDDLSFV